MTYIKKKSSVLELQKMDAENNQNINGAARNSTNSNFLCIGTPSMMSQFACGTNTGF